MARAGNLSSWARSMSRSSRQAPSSREYSVCRWRWTKSACDMRGFYTPAAAARKERLFTGNQHSTPTAFTQFREFLLNCFWIAPAIEHRPDANRLRILIVVNRVRKSLGEQAMEPEYLYMKTS